ncbi:MAG: serine/threonine protein kinase [Jatrophihabitans sp.]
MSELNGMSHFELSFGADGSLDDLAGAADDLRTALAAGPVRDVFVFAHGWNTSPASARALQRDLRAILADLLGPRRAASATVAINWPCLLFPEDDPQTELPTPSTGAQLANALSPAFPRQQFQLDELGALLDRQPAEFAELERFHSLAKTLVTSPSLALEDSGEAATLSAGTASLFGYAAAMARAPVARAPVAWAPDSGPFPALWSGAREVLRFYSYYEMKNRAGVVGREGLGPLLSTLRGRSGPPRLHLMGHSFGARLVAYALAGLAAPAAGERSPVKSLYLIQGALSHFAFADQHPAGEQERAGALTAFADLVDGPLIATTSSHDRCLGWWYPCANLLNWSGSGSVAALLHRWAAMGQDGYQGLGSHRRTLAAAGVPYEFDRGGQYVLDASQVIAANQSAFGGAHSDIRHAAVLWPIVSASA